MNEEMKIKKAVDSLKSEHLNPGVPTIKVCIGTPKYFEITSQANYDGTTLGLKNPENINWHASDGYAISEVNDRDKLSKWFSACTGLIVKGIDKKTKKNISFLTHQAFFASLSFRENGDHKLHGRFKADIEKALSKIKNRCAPGTVDAVIVGGDNDDQEAYQKTIELLSLETKHMLGFEPVIINGPKTEDWGKDSVYYDNENGRLYFIRPKVNSDTKDFTYSDIKDEKNK
jgi:hypothetical protein